MLKEGFQYIYLSILIIPRVYIPDPVPEVCRGDLTGTVLQLYNKAVDPCCDEA